MLGTRSYGHSPISYPNSPKLNGVPPKSEEVLCGPL